MVVALWLIKIMFRIFHWLIRICPDPRIVIVCSERIWA